jgi:FkbM family methyltransferase
MTYLKNRAREVLRRLRPAHVRFTRAGESFLAGGEREVHELPALVAPGSVALDVGAHIGDYTYSLCRAVGANGRVIAVEPIPDLARMLERATRRLRLPVTVLNCALSADPGQADLLIPVNNGRRAAGYATLERRVGTRGQVHRVALRRLDDVCRDLTARLSFAKIDVEGHELQVLRGATETLARHRPNLLIEIEQRHSTVPISETFDFLRSSGYRGVFLGADGSRRPLEEFDIATHQPANLGGTGSTGYVSNFIFLPA